MKVLDASGVINARDREIDGDFVTVPEIEGELKDIQSRLKFQAAVSTGKIKVEEPSGASLEKVDKVADKNGVLPLLSDVDLKVLALALEKGLSIVTDDYDIQNMCWILGLKFETIRELGIRETYKWKKRCSACGREYKQDIPECEVCGSKRFVVLRKS
jgi:UPF0271 protein